MGCRPIELVNVKKKRRPSSLNNNETYVNNVNDKGFNNAKASANANFGFNDDYDSAIIDLGSEINNGSNDDVAISDVKIELRQFDALYYKDVRLLVV